MDRQYIAIDLKSFFASVECVLRGRDPLTTNLVVADSSRTEKTICLAVTPALKSIGIPGRPRLFEVVQKVREENIKRKNKAPKGVFEGKSDDIDTLRQNPALELDYIIAPPQMACYMKSSTQIYNIYLKYVAPEDMHVYSIDEVFLDVTAYLDTYKKTARELAMTIIKDVLSETGITATAGIGTNMYLCKIAMDIVAKKMPADKDGVRIAELDEMSYRKFLWNHTPLTDFWRVGPGYMKKLHENGLFTMGDIARCSLGDNNDYHNEALLYKLFGVNAELLIDHAWGWEPTTIEMIKSYKPQNNSIGSGQVLHCAYTSDKAKLIVKEMTDLLVLDLVDKRLVAEQIVLTVGYDIENISNPDIIKNYHGEVKTDHYGRKVPKHAHGSTTLPFPTSSTKIIMDEMMALYDRIVNPNLLVRRLNVVANKVISEAQSTQSHTFEQLNLFTNYEELQKERELERKELEKEKKIQHAILDIQKKYGKNALIKGMNLEEGATTIDRNKQIGGHKA